ncbi:hypothetical protein CTI12_AA039260 [Artemisia annua]|uniref:DUF8039 domain-containing protein n=1 Tax=Artemisia annua TaxID=35608 RepID=A0A2U1QEQ6_ARTAN|nr:hypothetical protein CTI12_AA039260 [Artemisia annua]
MERPRKERGINKVEDLLVGESVRFNKLGVAVGKNRHIFAKYCGNAVRRRISILYRKWDKIDHKEKEMLWLDIKGKMRLEDDDKIQGVTLKSCGSKWRAFKNTLRASYMVMNIRPRSKYTFLEPQVWKEICRIEHYNEEKLRKREEARARARKQTNRPRVGAKGFAAFEEQWEEERNDPNRATDLHKIPGHGSSFCLGRRRPDKDGNLVPTPETAELAKKLVEASEQLSQGTIESQHGVDPLIIVYGPEHGGRTRGDKVLEALRKEPGLGMGSVGSTTSNIKADCIKEPTICALFSPESILTGEKILCAHATLYPVGDGLIHGKRLRKGHMRVSVSKVLRLEELELPVPDEDIPNLGGTVGAFIQWPIGAIARFSVLLVYTFSILLYISGLPNTPTTRATAKSTLPTNVQGPSTATKSTLTKNVQGPSTECAALVTLPTITQASKKRKKTLKEPVKLSKAEKEKADIRKRLHSLKEDIDERSEAVKKGYYRWMAHEDCAMPQMVYFKKEIFRDVDDFTLPINPIDIIELLTAEKLGTNILTLFLSGHHVLLIICPKHGRGFILDSYKWEKKRTKEDYYLVKQVERVVGHLSWELPVVNLQEDTWECGFYVMKWVLDFVLKYQHDDFPNILPWGEERSLSISEIDAVVNAWFSLWRDF